MYITVELLILAFLDLILHPSTVIALSGVVIAALLHRREIAPVVRHVFPVTGWRILHEKRSQLPSQHAPHAANFRRARTAALSVVMEG